MPGSGALFARAETPADLVRAIHDGFHSLDVLG